MFTQEEIDAVLQEAQEAAESLARETGAVPRGTGAKSTRSRPAERAGTRRDRSGAAAAPSGDRRQLPVERVLQIRVPLVVRLAERRMPLAEVVKLAPGSIIEFDRSVDREIDLLVNNTWIASGEAIKVGERFGLRIKALGSVHQRIRSLGPA